MIGLQHEHQRPDRGNALWYYCRYLEGYAQGVNDADIDEKAIFDDDLDEQDRINSM